MKKNIYLLPEVVLHDEGNEIEGHGDDVMQQMGAIPQVNPEKGRLANETQLLLLDHLLIIDLLALWTYKSMPRSGGRVVGEYQPLIW